MVVAPDTSTGLDPMFQRWACHQSGPASTLPLLRDRRVGQSVDIARQRRRAGRRRTHAELKVIFKRIETRACNRRPDRNWRQPPLRRTVERSIKVGIRVRVAFHLHRTGTHTGHCLQSPIRLIGSGNWRAIRAGSGSGTCVVAQRVIGHPALVHERTTRGSHRNSRRDRLGWRVGWHGGCRRIRRHR